MLTPRSSSNECGIIFYSVRHPDYMVVATYDTKTETITTKWVKVEEKRQSKLNLFLISLGLIILIIITCINLYWGLLTCRILIGCISILLIIKFIIKIIMIKHSKYVPLYHGAEHMILNASSKTGKIPNLEEIRNYSIFRWDCSTNFDLFLIIIFVTAFIATFSRTLPDFFIYVSEAIIIVESGMLLGFFNFIQILTTATPTDKELEVAIAGMKAWYEHEYECETDKHECETENEEEKK